jgi:hypothetical protein
MLVPRLALALASCFVTLAISQPAEAQIYTWRDANGNPVVGDTLPRGTQPLHTYAVPGATKTLLATRPVEAGFGSQFDTLISHYSATSGIRADLVRAVIQVESGFNPRARSPKGAKGLMQLMPGTALDLGVENAYDPEQNIRGGVQYLRMLLDRYGNDETLALAAYNAGPNAVEKYGNAIPPYRETQDYVERVQHISPLAAAAAATASSRSAGQAQAVSVPGLRILYKTVALNADGQPVARYSDTKPASGAYEVFSYRR